MPVSKDNAKYDALHIRLLRDILLAIKDELESTELDHDEIHDLTAKIAMSISGILDGRSPVEMDGENLIPFVAFCNEAQRERLIVNDQGSYLHELVDSLFETLSAEDEEEYEDKDEEEYEYEEDEDEPAFEEEEEEEESEDDDDDAANKYRH